MATTALPPQQDRAIAPSSASANRRADEHRPIRSVAVGAAATRVL